MAHKIDSNRLPSELLPSDHSDSSEEEDECHDGHSTIIQKRIVPATMRHKKEVHKKQSEKRLEDYEYNPLEKTVKERGHSTIIQKRIVPATMRHKKEVHKKQSEKRLEDYEYNPLEKTVKERGHNTIIQKRIVPATSETSLEDYEYNPPEETVEERGQSYTSYPGTNKMPYRDLRHVYLGVPLEKYDNYYPTGRGKHRGYVLIINNYDFEEKGALPKGEDVDRIGSLFIKHKYKVRRFENVGATDIKKLVKKYAKKEKGEALVCFISSHGNSNGILGIDGETVKMNRLLKAADTKQLKEKPKCFFIDACRSEEERSMGRPELPGDDFYLGMSCLAKGKSFTKKRTGNFYFGIIAKIFEQSFPCPRTNPDGPYQRDIDYLMKKVNRDVNEFARQHKITQTPVIESTLRYQLFLQLESEASSDPV